MGIRPRQFDEAAAALQPLFDQSRRRLIAIDGRMLSGKTTLGRFLAWRFNAPLVERDMFLGPDGLRVEEIGRYVSGRLAWRNPVIIEGVFMCELLEQIGHKPDLLFYAANDFGRQPLPTDEQFIAYEERYTPMSRADYKVSWTF